MCSIQCAGSTERGEEIFEKIDCTQSSKRWSKDV